MVPGGEVHDAEDSRFGMADAFEQTTNERYRPTRWLGAIVETTIVDAKAKRVQRSLYDDRVAVIHCIRWFDDLV